MENNKHTLESQMQSQKSNTYLIRLERYTNDLIQTTILLNNYNYEPKTKELFELKDFLKHKFENLLQTNKRLIQQLNLYDTENNDLVNSIKTQIKALIQLQAEIKEYCCLAHNNSRIIL